MPHEPGLRGWLARRGIADHDIDDIVQETYAKLVTLASVEGIRDPRSYTYQVALSVHVTNIRKANVIPLKIIPQADQSNIAALDPSPEQIVGDRGELEQLAQALTKLPDKCRAVFLARRVEGLSHRETAEKFGISEKTVEKHMAKGIRFLMDLFGRGGKPVSGASIERLEQTERHHGA
jgi:RNA polymerase sigma-70 factor (ECF subfamily)